VRPEQERSGVRHERPCANDDACYIIAKQGPPPPRPLIVWQIQCIDAEESVSYLNHRKTHLLSPSCSWGCIARMHVLTRLSNRRCVRF
jgi:hypothetical protein